MKRIAVLTSGGDAPGMNAAIRAVVKKGHYEGLDVYGVRYGFAGLVAGDFVRLTEKDVEDKISSGGTFLFTARFPEFIEEVTQREALKQLKTFGIDGLVVIGGDGSFRGASALSKYGFPTVGVPGTIDNDIPGTDFTVGFDTAINTVLESVDKVRDTATSHMRTFIIEVMGRNAGDIALWVGVAGAADQVIIPEKHYQVEDIATLIQQGKDQGKKHSLIILAEGVMRGHELAAQLNEIDDYHARVTVLGHVQRGGIPSARDRVLGSSFGAKAVGVLLDKKTGVFLGIHGTDISVLDIDDTLTNQVHRPELELYRLNHELASCKEKSAPEKKAE